VPRKRRVAELPTGGRREHRTEVAVHPLHDRLRLGVSEPNIEFQHLRPLGRHHQPAIQEAGERASLRVHVLNDRKHNGIENLLRLRFIKNTAVAICTHATRVRTSVAIVDRFVILRWCEWQDVSPVTQNNEADLFARKKLFDDEPGSCLANQLA
jgi:hypothetical protein